MSNMKFAFRKLAITCILPATLFQGPLTAEILAQNVPSAISKSSAGLPTRRATPPKKIPSEDPRVPAPSAGTNGAQPIGNEPAAPALIRQVANPAAPQGAPNGRETDVQRQLRMLYEKSGQEMPAMSMDELEVPEPQAGVNPGGAAPGMVPPGSNYAQPPMPPQKAPNLFERVFLGKKAPPPVAPRPLPQRPQYPASGQIRFAQPNGNVPPAGGQPRTNNYRPYQTGQQGVAPQNSQGQGGNNGQYSGTPNPQYQGQQPPVVQQQPAAVQQPAATVQQPLQYNPQLPSAAGQAQRPVNQSPAAVAVPRAEGPQSSDADAVPLLDDDVEESLEIDLNPKSKATPVITPGATEGTSSPRGGVIPPPEPTATPPATPTATETPETSSATEQTAEENPFSGLKLSVPESDDAPADAAAPKLKSPAANAVSPPKFDEGEKEDDPFLQSSEDEPEEDLKVSAPPAKITEQPKATEQPKVIVAPNQPAAAANRSVETGDVNPFEEPKEIKSASKSAADLRLQQLADAVEKTGLKGFCPVALRQKRQLIPAKPQFKAVHQGQKYHLSSAEAKATFEKSPHLFAPAHTGRDAIALLDDEKSLPGTLDYSAWFQGRLYLFASQEHLVAFNESPEQYLDDDEPAVTDSKSKTPVITASQAKSSQAAKPAVAGTPVGQSSVRPVSPKTPAVTDELPVLPENLDDFKPLAPPESNTAEAKPVEVKPAVGKPAAGTPPAVKPQTKQSAVAAPAKGPNLVPPGQAKPVQKPVAPKVTAPQGPELGKTADLKTPQTPAGNSQPSPKVPANGAPRLISPDLQLVPSATSGTSK